MNNTDESAPVCYRFCTPTAALYMNHFETCMGGKRLVASVQELAQVVVGLMLWGLVCTENSTTGPVRSGAGRGRHHTSCERGSGPRPRPMCKQTQ